MERFVSDINGPSAYPAVHHIGIVVSKDFGGKAALADALAENTIVTALHDGQQSRQGKYRTLRVSVRVTSLDELVALDAKLRAVAGVLLLM